MRNPSVFGSLFRPLAALAALASAAAAGIDLRLPTENHHLFTGEPDRFYMYVDRTFEGETSKPWEGGGYGYVRTPIRVAGQVVFTRFHEGIDISPVKRDRAGNPLDLVMSIADGRVVYVSPIAGRSNYGKYLVVEHDWENSKVYSLYAHLAEITCEAGDAVRAGSVLGRMGYTGVGLNRTRAHLHLELAVLLSERFDDWWKVHYGSVNFHGLFNGINLAGCDVAGFFLAHRENPQLRFSEFMAGVPVHFKVTAPATGTPEFVTRHPWMLRDGPQGAPSWEISFSATGLPLAFAPSGRQVDQPVVSSIRPSEVPHRHMTRNLVTGQGNQATLTAGGRALVSLVMEAFPSADAEPSAARH